MTHLTHIAVAAATLARPSTCHVRVVPANAGEDWHVAASHLAEMLAAVAPGDRDCRDVVIRAEALHPSVEVTTLDGRRGVRMLASAREIEPTVSAMVVTVTAPDVRVRAEEAEQPAVALSGENRWRVLVVAAGGGRLILPDVPAPVVELMLGVTRGPWELAMFGSWAPDFLGRDTGAASTDTTTSSGLAWTGELGLSLAGRHQAGGADLLAGMRLSAVRLPASEGGDTQTMGSGNDVVGPSFAPAVALFVGASVPRRTAVHVRPQLSFQWIPPLRAGTSVAPASIFSVGLSLGAESRTP